jgi:hypothetical protein
MAVQQFQTMSIQQMVVLHGGLEMLAQQLHHLSSTPPLHFHL